MPEAKFTEEQMNNMLGIQELSLQLSTLDTSLNSLKQAFEAAAKLEDTELRSILDKMGEEKVERIQCKNDIREEVYERFLQKKDLRTYLTIVVVVVSFTTGAIQWILGNQTASVSTEVISTRNEAMVNKLMDKMDKQSRTTNQLLEKLK